MKLFDYFVKAQKKADAPKRVSKAPSVEVISKQILRNRDSMIRNGFKEYTFIANRDCCPICRKLNGKHFTISNLKIGVNAPPMHEGCKCSIAAYEDEKAYQAWLNSL